MVQNNIEQGKVKGPRHMMDNYCFSMDEEGDKLIKNENFAPYYEKGDKQSPSDKALRSNSKNISQNLGKIVQVDDGAANEQNDNSQVIHGIYQS